MAGPQGQRMMPPQMPPRAAGRQARWAQWLTEQQVVWKSLPKWLSAYSIIAYVLALTMVTIMYTNYSMAWYYMLSGIVAVLMFFLLGRYVSRRTSIGKQSKSKRFEKQIFLIAFVPRVLYMLLLYWIFQENYGDALGFENQDALFYLETGEEFADAIESGKFVEVWKKTNEIVDISDLGYVTYVGFLYWLTGKSIIALRLIKCLLSSLTVILVYRLAKLNFDSQTARIAAIFCALWPNFWYYCAVHLKETEMVFLSVLFVEQADQMLKSRKFTVWKVVPVLLIAAALFTFRSPLAFVAILALVFSVVMSSSKVITWGKRIIVGLLAVLLVGVIAGNMLEEKARELIENQSKQQESGITFYATRKDNSGNQQSFAKYAGTAVFAPMIFTLPFPSMTRPFEGQDQQQLQNGGNFVKNVVSFFTIFALFALLLSGKWRDHLLPLSFLLGYLAVLALSSFAHSERFHQPAMPFEFMFAAYGLSIAVTKKRYKRWFVMWCILMFIAAIAWNWFKLKGRGII
jgi:4-amino-4-deoxy-L-arabinose transferase-like glycosyltransferase